jgi:hypothetical protein
MFSPWRCPKFKLSILRNVPFFSLIILALETPPQRKKLCVKATQIGASSYTPNLRKKNNFVS